MQHRVGKLGVGMAVVVVSLACAGPEVPHSEPLPVPVAAPVEAEIPEPPAQPACKQGTTMCIENILAVCERGAWKPDHDCSTEAEGAFCDDAGKGRASCAINGIL